MLYGVTIAAYLLALLAVGLWKSRGVATQDDIMVAGRSLGPNVLALTMLATWIGTGSLLGGAGAGYRYGLAAIWLSAGAWAGIIVLWWIAPRARAFASYTVPEMLEARYHPAARVLGTVVTIVAYTTIVAYQFRGGSLILNLALDFDRTLAGWTGLEWPWGMICTAAVVMLYTALAGMLSVAYTDVANGLILIAGLLIATPFFLADAGGFSHLRDSLPAEHFTFMGTLSPLQVLGIGLPALVLILGEANMYQRFFSARSEQAARRAVPLWFVLTVGVETLIVLLAVLGRVVYPELSIEGGEHEQILLRVLRFALPAGAAALLLAAGVAIVVSTATSFLLVPATNLINDVYKRYLRPRASQRSLVGLTRLAIVLLGLLAFVQIQFFTSVLEMSLYAYTMYGALTPSILAARHGRRRAGLHRWRHADHVPVAVRRSTRVVRWAAGVGDGAGPGDPRARPVGRAARCRQPVDAAAGRVALASLRPGRAGCGSLSRERERDRERERERERVAITPPGPEAFPDVRAAHRLRAIGRARTAGH
jgi:SSS family solute:Na+ symporter